jgi:copper transport protein
VGSAARGPGAGRVPVPGRAGRRLAATVAMLAGWALAGLVMAAPAQAHAQLLGSDPAEGARLQTAPARVTLSFSEGVRLQLGHLHVVDARGERVEAGPAVHPDGDGSRISVPLRAGLGNGSYLVSYGVVSQDSHPVSGGYAFVVGSGPLVTASGAISDGAGTDPVIGTLFAVTRWVSYAGLALLGGLVFVVVFWPGGRTNRRTRTVIRLGWTAAAASTVASLLLQGPYAAGAGIGAVLSPDLLPATLSSPYGRILGLRLAALVALGVVCVRALRDPDRLPEQVRARDENIGLVAGLALVASFAGAGHASAGIQPTVALVSDMGHLAAMSVWLGGLVVLVGCLLPAGTPAEVAAVLPRFSRLAFAAVTILVVTGTYQAWRSVGSIPALWETGYGRLLAVKIAGVVALIWLGNLSRLAVRRRYTEPVPVGALATGSHAGDPGDPGNPDDPDDPGDPGDPGNPDDPDDQGDPGDRGGLPPTRLRTSIGLEVAIAAAVLALSAVLVSTAPARATYVRPYRATVQLAHGETAQISVSPAHPGVNTVQADLRDGRGRPLAAREVSLSIALPAEQLGPLPMKLVGTGPGSYQASGVSLSRPGAWQLTIRVRTAEFDATVAQADLPVR